MEKSAGFYNHIYEFFRLNLIFDLCATRVKHWHFVNKCKLLPVATSKVQNLILCLSNELSHYFIINILILHWYTKICVLGTSIVW